MLQIYNNYSKTYNNFDLAVDGAGARSKSGAEKWELSEASENCFLIII